MVRPSVVDRIVNRMSEKQPLYRCFQFDRKAKETPSLSRYYHRNNTLCLYVGALRSLRRLASRPNSFGA